MAKHLLRGKVIAITGGASGIGFATVQKLIALEAKIAVADISPCPDTLAGVPNLTFTRVNVTSREQVHDWVVAIVAKFGRLDGMCANAGINVEDGSLEPDFAYHKTVDVRLTGVWHCGTEAHWQFQRQQSPGVICITSSLAGLRPSPNTPIYSAVKAATIGFTRAWALDWAAEGIRVNSVAPGKVLLVASTTANLINCKASPLRRASKQYSNRYLSLI